MDDVKGLNDRKVITQVSMGSGPASTIDVMDIRWPTDGAEDDMASTDRDVLRRIAGPQGELRWCRLDEIGHHVAAEPHHQRLFVDDGTGNAEPPPRVAVKDPDA